MRGSSSRGCGHTILHLLLKMETVIDWSSNSIKSFFVRNNKKGNILRQKLFLCSFSLFCRNHVFSETKRIINSQRNAKQTNFTLNINNNSRQLTFNETGQRVWIYIPFRVLWRGVKNNTARLCRFDYSYKQ